MGGVQELTEVFCRWHSAAMAPVKRGATFAGNDTKRRCQVVAKAVQSSETLSLPCKTMLAGMAPAALKTYKEERHPYQVSMVEMIKTTLKEVEDGMARKNVQLEKEVAKANETKTDRSAAVS